MSSSRESPEDIILFDMYETTPLPRSFRVIHNQRNTVNKMSNSQASILSERPYILNTESYQSQDVDRWMGGESKDNLSRPTPQAAGTTHQHRLPARLSSISSKLLWCLIGCSYPLLSVTADSFSRCNASAVFARAEDFFNGLARLCGQLREKIRELGRDQTSWELISGMVNVVLVCYAVSFIAFSMQQVSKQL